MKVAEIPMARTNGLEQAIMQLALDFQLIDQVDATFHFTIGEDLDKFIPAGWTDPTGAAVGDEHIGRCDEILAQDEPLVTPPIDAGNEIHAIDADGSTNEEPALAVDEEPGVVGEEFEMGMVHAAIEERGI